MRKNSNDTTAARIAAVFGRQQASRVLTVDEIAADACRLAKLGQQARAALARKRSPAAQVRAAKAIAGRYGATIVDQRDLEGMVVGVKFHMGIYSSGFRNFFFVA